VTADDLCCACQLRWPVRIEARMHGAACTARRRAYLLPPSELWRNRVACVRIFFFWHGDALFFQHADTLFLQRCTYKTAWCWICVSCCYCVHSRTYLCTNMSHIGKKVPEKLYCSQGKDCINGEAVYVAKKRRWDADRLANNVFAGSEPVQAAYQCKTASAVRYNINGWLPCKHYCCDFLSPEALALCEERGEQPLTCAQRHTCKKPGDRDLAVYRAALEERGLLPPPRPYQVKSIRKDGSEVSNAPLFDADVFILTC
jgi:hypothetical protein